jgi:hypothetical protein
MPEFEAILAHGAELLWDCLATRWFDSGKVISAKVELLLLLLNGWNKYRIDQLLLLNGVL